MDDNQGDEYKLKCRKYLLEYIEFFERLNKRSIRLIEKIVEHDIYFKDPFNEVRNVEGLIKIFEHMFDNTHDPKFKVLDYGFSKQGDCAYLRWLFSCNLKKRILKFEGASHIQFSPSGKIMSHIDYWDAAENFYEKLPVIGSILRWVKKKMKV